MTLAKFEPHRESSLVVAEDMQELENRFALAVKQRELLAAYIEKQLEPDKHFYKVSGGKNSLTKEGAEIVCLAHGYKPAYDKLAGPDEPPEDGRPYQITVKCRLLLNGTEKGEGLGSASSYLTTRSGDYKPRQNDPGLCHNATLKMAQKSAYIAATLNSTAASEFFTQDMEPGTSEEKVDTTAHYCGQHKTNWFKRGSMSGYAHPKDGGGWCNESASEPGTVAHAQRPEVIENKPAPHVDPKTGVISPAASTTVPFDAQRVAAAMRDIAPGLVVAGKTAANIAAYVGKPWPVLEALGADGVIEAVKKRKEELIKADYQSPFPDEQTK